MYVFLGVKLVATAMKSELRYVRMEEAGLLDYYTNSFVPALQVDKNYHLFSDLHITRSSSTGRLPSQSNISKLYGFRANVSNGYYCTPSTIILSAM